MGRRDGSRGAWVLRLLLVVSLAAAVALTGQSQALAEDGDEVRVIVLSDDDFVGEELGSIKKILAIAAAPGASGNVYIIATFTNSGRFAAGVLKFDSNGDIVAQWRPEDVQPYGDGTPGYGLFIAVGSDDSIYVTDPYLGSNSEYDDRLLRFSDSTRISPVNWPSLLASKIKNPRGVAVDSVGDIYVSHWEYPIYSVMKFSREGNLLWTADEEFFVPEGLAVRNGSVYVADAGKSRVVKLDSESGEKSQWSPRSKLDWPQAVAVDSEGSVYVADRGNNRVVKFNANGGYLKEWDGFEGPFDVSVDSLDNVYVADETRRGDTSVMKITTGASYVSAEGNGSDCSDHDAFTAMIEKEEFDFGALIDCVALNQESLLEAGQLKEVTVEPQGRAGSEGTVKVSFKTANPVPAGGKVEVTFPEGFEVTEDTKVTAIEVQPRRHTLQGLESLDHSLNTPYRSVTIELNNSAEIPDGATFELTLTGIRHPGVSYDPPADLSEADARAPKGGSIGTLTSDGAHIDECVKAKGEGDGDECEITYEKIKPGILTDLGFRLEWEEGDPPMPPNYVLELLGHPKEREVVAGDRSILEVPPTAAGSTGDVLLSFTTANPVPAGGKVEVTFPEGFEVGDGVSLVLVPTLFEGEDQTSLHATVVKDDSARVTIQELEAGIGAGATVHLMLSNITNPPVTGVPKGGGVVTKDSCERDLPVSVEGGGIDLDCNGAVIDHSIDEEVRTEACSDDSVDQSDIDCTDQVTVNRITPGKLTDNGVVLETTTAGGTGYVTVTFTLDNPLPGKGMIAVTFPEGFVFSKETTEATFLDPLPEKVRGEDLEVDVIKHDGGMTALITRPDNSEGLGEGQSVKLKLTEIRNPQVSGQTNNFEIRTSVGK